MKENDKLLDAIIDLGVGMKALREEMKGMRKDMNTQFGELNHRVEKLEKQQAKTNIELAEMRLSYMQIDKRLTETNVNLQGLRSDFNKYANSNNLIISGHEKRIIRLEDATFNNDKRISMVKEPNAEYKIKRKKRIIKHGK